METRLGEIVMVAYLYADIEVTDPAAYGDYRRGAQAVVAAQGGRHLARGGAAELLEGAVPPHRVALIELPDKAHLKAFYHSPDYQALIALKRRASRAHFIAIEGIREIKMSKRMQHKAIRQMFPVASACLTLTEEGIDARRNDLEEIASTHDSASC